MSIRNVFFVGVAVLVLLNFQVTRCWSATVFQQVGVASSPNPVGSGARAMGMGGAFIGIADDATAASWNPAGLIQLEKPELSLVGAYHDRREEFISNSHPEINNVGEVDGADINYFSFTYPFHFYRNIVVSLNYQRLYEFERGFTHRLDFSSEGLDLSQTKRFEQEGYLGALGLAGAIEISPTISLGATLNIWTDKLLWDNGWTETYLESAMGTMGGVPVTIDTQIYEKYSDFSGINANLGFTWNFHKGFTLGAVLKTPFEATIDHEFKISQESAFAPPVDTIVTSGQEYVEEVSLDMPLSYGIGLAWRVSDALSFDLDIYRTHWSDYILTDSQGNSFSPIDGRPESESSIDDTTQVRLGGEYLFISQENDMVVPVRAGLLYDPEPSTGSVKKYYGIALGSGVTYKQFVFDVAYQFRWADGVNTGHLIASSEADVSQHTFLASVIVHF
jgi:long-subunit fatty acid transport protein